MLLAMPSLGRSGLLTAAGRAKKLCLTAAGGLCGGRGGLAFLLRCGAVSNPDTVLPACQAQGIMLSVRKDDMQAFN